MPRRLLLAVTALALGTTGLASAQELATPIYKGPYRAFQQSELGAYLSDPGNGISIALQGEYRRAQRKGQFDWGITFAYQDPSGPGGDGIFGIGGDVRAGIARHTTEFPLDASITAGFGALFSSGNNGFLVPLGVTLGRQVALENSSVSFVPWVHPVIAPAFGDFYDSVQFGLGLGVDINLSRTWDARLSGGLGDIDGFGVGLAWHR
jgi:hypothetical protein